MAESYIYTNRLIHEKSPYLLQHAHNPVDWYAWGPEAFEAARSQGKPIFLSIGYATCHWCHVMEKESFEDVEIAKSLNDNFINIKVDREELPEVDSLYMEFAQSMMSGAAGWPLNLILTPELLPFFASTYLPPYASHGLPGLNDLIDRVCEVWHGEDRELVQEQAERILSIFAENIHTKGEEIPEKDLIDDAVEMLLKMADPIYGGIKGIPKFPIGYQWNFLCRYAALKEDGRSLFLAEKTLDMLHRGGIYDHLGGGFSRYSVDEKWLVPHFEKMLYDNALLAYTYLDAWRFTQKDVFRTVSEEILQYILRDMTHPQGGFYSAEDADSEGHEGYFYTWKDEEIRSLLGDDNAKLFREFFQVTSLGNFEGRNILHTPYTMEEFAAKKGMQLEDLEELFTKQKQVLWKAREKRPHPFKDDKILVSWNGLMIFAMAEAGATFDEPQYTQAAVKAAKFIKNEMWKNGELLRRWRDGEAMHDAGLDDYAFLIKGVLSLFETGQGTEWLEWAIEMAEILSENFKVEEGAFYQTNGHDPSILLRKCQFADGAEPSGNAIHCENLLRLYALTMDEEYLNEAEDIFKAVKKYMDNYPPGYTYHLMNLLRFYDKKSMTAVIALNKNKSHQTDILRLLYHTFIPCRSVVWKEEKDKLLKTLIPFTEKQSPVEGETTLYLCQNGSCQAPKTNLTDMIAAIHDM